MKVDKKIAYQTVDPEGDAWSNNALLFNSDEQAEAFFKNPEQVLDALGFELYKGENIEDIGYHTTRQQITFCCQYAGEVRIVKMSGGVVLADPFAALRAIQLRLTNMGYYEFERVFCEATGQDHPTTYMSTKHSEFLSNPTLFITTRLDEKTGAKFLELCMNS